LGSLSYSQMVRRFTILSCSVRRTCGTAGALVSALICAASILAHASTPQKARPHRPAHRKLTRSQEHPCGQGIVLRINSPKSSQGSLLLIELRSTKVLGQLQGTWTDKEIRFWKQNKPDEARPDIWRAL